MKFNEGKARGGIECCCSDLAGCDERIAQNVRHLGKAVGVSSPQKGTGKGQGKHQEKSKHRQYKGKNKWPQ